MAPSFRAEAEFEKRSLAKRAGTSDESSASPVASKNNAELAAGDNKATASSSPASQTTSGNDAGSDNGGGILGGLGSIVSGATSDIGSAVGLPAATSTTTTSQTTSESTSTSDNDTTSKQAASTSPTADTTSTSTQSSQTTSSSSTTTTQTTSTTTSTSPSLTALPTLSTPTNNAIPTQTLVFTSSSDGVAVTTVTSFPPTDPSAASPTSLASQTTSGSSTFFNNKPLVGAVFGIGGLVALVVIISVLTFALRRARRSRLENDAADVDGTIDWSADAGVGGSLSNTGYSGMPIIGQLERSGTTLNRNSSGRSTSSRNASDSPIGSEDGLLGGRSGSANGYYSNYGASAEGPAAAANLGRRPSNGEQQMGMAMAMGNGNAMPVSVNVPLNRATSVSRQEGTPVNVPGQPYVPAPLPPSLALSNAPRPYGSQQQQQQQQARPQRESIRAYAFQRQQTAQLPYTQQRSYPQPGQAITTAQQAASVGAYPSAQHGRNGSDSDGANTFDRKRSGSGDSAPGSPGDEGDYYAEYNYGGQTSTGPGLRVANE